MDSRAADRSDVGDARAELYGLLSAAYRFPDASLVNAFASGDWGAEVRSCFAQIGCPIDDGVPLRLTARQDEYEVEFLRLFEVGMGGAPCPLSSGYYTRDRMRDLEEVVRFYRFFGYQPQRTADRFPDHLAFELEFMAHLAAKARGANGDFESLRLAQRDFVERHLVSWLPELCDAVQRRAEIGFVRDLVGATALLADQDLRRLDASSVPETRAAWHF